MRAWLALACCLCAWNVAWAQSSAAKVMAVSGQARAVDAQGGIRPLEKGAELFTGDKVVTTDNSLVQLRLHDGGYMSVRANTEMVIDQFVLDEKEPNKSSFLVSLLRGGFRSITGLIGRTNPNGYRIRAATATIGIRGTDHEPVLVLDTPEESAQSQNPPGVYDKVNDGETFISNKGGMLALKRGDIGFAPLNAEIPPQVLLKIPQFYRVMQKIEAREAKDGSDDKSDGDKRAGGTLLRPSLAARRDALSGNTDGKGVPGGQPGSPDAPGSNNTAPTTSPNPTKPAAAAAAAATGTAPALTPEQKRAVLQTLTSTPPKSDTTTPGTTLTAPKAPAPITTPTPLPK